MNLIQNYILDYILEHWIEFFSLIATVFGLAVGSYCLRLNLKIKNLQIQVRDNALTQINANTIYQNYMQGIDEAKSREIALNVANEKSSELLENMNSMQKSLAMQNFKLSQDIEISKNTISQLQNEIQVANNLIQTMPKITRTAQGTMITDQNGGLLFTRE